MQHKRRLVSAKNGLILLVLAVAGVSSLAFITIPAPQQPIEKTLDAKVFLEQKPQ